jgi:hypothetical protein
VKASELIAALSALIEEHGDLPVYAPCPADEYGDSDYIEPPVYCAEVLPSFAALATPERFYIAP